MAAKRIHLIILSCFAFLFFFVSPVCVWAAALNQNICTQTQCVKIQNGYLWVLSADNATYAPYFIKAVGYQPTPIGRYPSDWGYAAADPRSINNNIYDDPNILNRDFTLLTQMNANTIRIWSGNKRTVSCSCTNNGRYTSFLTNAANTANKDSTQNTLDIANSYGLKVIAGFWLNYLTFDASNTIGSFDDNGLPLTRAQIINNFVAYVNAFKGNRAVLFWAIGNENNYEVVNGHPVQKSAFESAFGISQGDSIFNWLQQNGNIIDFDGDIIVNINAPAVVNQIQLQYPGNFTAILNVLKQFSGQSLTPAQLTSWYSLVDAMAQAAHAAEGAAFHPVALVNGGTAEIGSSANGTTDAQMPNLDIWGANEYLGQSFGSLFSTYAAQSKKPLWISEYGIDAMSVTNSAGINDWGLTLASDQLGSGTYDPANQSSWDGGLWNEIAGNFPVTFGGSLMEYADEWWKPNEFYCTNAGAGQTNNAVSSGICNANQKLFGFPETSSPDNFSNEEWYGVMSISANPVAGGADLVAPRTVYNHFQTLWQSNPWPTLNLNITGAGAGTINSSAGLGSSLNCSLASGADSGTCAWAFAKSQPVTLSFSSTNNSKITNWGVNGCAASSTSCTFTPSSDVTVNVTVAAPPAQPKVSLASYIYSFAAPAVDYLVATATEQGGSISKVELYNGSTLIATVLVPEFNAPNYDYLWFNLAPGSYSLTAKAYDANGNTTTSSPPVAFTVTGAPSVVPPTVNMTSPANNATVVLPANVILSASASSANGISRVDFYNGTALLGTAFSSPYTYTWVNPPAGTYSLTAKATDGTGTSNTSSAVTITVASPAANAPKVVFNAYIYAFNAPAVAYLVATATEVGGMISKVEFYNGTTLVATTNVPEFNAPNYDYLWFNMPAGNYNLTAKAYDTNNHTTVSAAVNFTVVGAVSSASASLVTRKARLKPLRS